MPASVQDRILVPCPKCGHRQLEPRSAISTNCRACGGYFQLQAALHPSPKPVEVAVKQRRIACFDCGAEWDVAVTAESTMCRRCGNYVDLKDYRITSTVSKNFKTKGTFILEAKAYALNTDSLVGDAIIRGRLVGRIVAERSLTLHSTAEIKGTFKTARLIIPEDNRFRWPEPIRVGGASIGGELSGDLHADGTVLLKAGARLFGSVTARNLVVEAGAVMVGQANVGPRRR
jgi:cytoskeletal protein CcmA (bactofilin family)